MARICRCALTVILVLIHLSLTFVNGRAEFRSFDGAGNNLTHPEWGAAKTDFARMAPVDYADGISAARLSGRPNPRSVGLALFRQSTSLPNNRLLSGYVYAFGNFISHDTQNTVSGTTESVPFLIPSNDDIYAQNQTVPLPRSLFDPATGKSRDNPRQQINFASAFIDASQVYGSDATTASVLRGGPANPGAKLRTSNDINGDAENLLPRNAFGPAPDAPFVAGDDRVNDNIVLTAMHTLFMREHNRLVDVFAAAHPAWSAEDLYQRARKTVGAEIQAITFNEFLPALLGPYAPTPTGQYDPNLDPSVFNEFPTVFLRVGHSMLPNAFQRVQNDGRPAPGGPLQLVDAFNDPSKLTTSSDLNLFLKGLSIEVQEESDLKFVDAMRVALLDAFDIQRARDHGLPDYNTFREAYGLPRVTSFAQITSDTAAQQAIATVYPDINAIDPLVGALAEDHLPGASVGPLVAAGLRLQFEHLRDGDRFWYDHDPDFTASEIDALRQTRLSDIIAWNTGVTNLQSDVFYAIPEPGVWPLIVSALGPWMLARRRSVRGSF
jgi:peroxidase